MYILSFVLEKIMYYHVLQHVPEAHDHVTLIVYQLTCTKLCISYCTLLPGVGCHHKSSADDSQEVYSSSAPWNILELGTLL